MPGWLGMSEDAESLYRVLLTDSDDSPADLSERLGWPAPRIAAALDELADNSLVRHEDRDGHPRPRLTDPETALNALQLRLETEALERQRQAAESRDQINTLIDAYRRDRRELRSGPYVEELVGAEAVRARLVEAADKVEHETMAFSPGGAMGPTNLVSGLSHNMALLSRGVSMRIVYLDSVRNDQAVLDYLARMTVAGAQIRTVPALALRMIILDRTTAFVPIDLEDSSAGALLLHGRSLVAPLVTLFDLKWAVGAPVGGLPDVDGAVPSAQHQAVLLLLFAGHTDETIARRLGVSLRTARRVIADLMTRLGARGRFHAGARAAELGWLPVLTGAGTAEHRTTGALPGHEADEADEADKAEKAAER